MKTKDSKKGYKKTDKMIRGILANRVAYNIVDKQKEKVAKLLQDLDNKYGVAFAIKWIEEYLQVFIRSRTKEVTKKRIYHILKSWE